MNIITTGTTPGFHPKPFCIPEEIVQNIVQFLPSKEIIKCGDVNKFLYSVSQTRAYPKSNSAVQKVWQAYFEKKQELEGIIEKRLPTILQKSKWNHHIAPILYGISRIFTLIRDLVMFLFPATRNDAYFQKKHIEAEIQATYTKYSQVLAIQKGRRIIMELFGGEHKFEKIPILKLPRGYPEQGGSFDETSMSAPIMRGQDNLGREFVILRAVLIGDCSSTFVSQCICQDSDMSWNTRGWKIVEANSTLIDQQGKLVDKKGYNDFSQFLQTGWMPPAAKLT